MFDKKIIFMAIAVTAFTHVSAQSILENNKPQSAAAKLAAALSKTAPAASGPAVASAPAASAPVASAPPAAAPVPVSISEQSAIQAKSLEAETLKKIGNKGSVVLLQEQRQVVPELKPDSAISVVLDKDMKKAKPVSEAPIRPYLAYVMGMRGAEIAELRMGAGRRATIRAGESFQNWQIVKIEDGKVFLTETARQVIESGKKKKKEKMFTPASKVLRVGDYL
ncbi:hypothetical protein [Janthinobacterium sp. MDT1-19]|uniref:hypothetical protein n=1 Tax=Janthinobacterium sp. MDT1-19 TaxID=1259339 RepID=UPI003F2172F7